MSSVALQRWHSDGKTELDEIVAAHRAVGGLGRGRRHATREINHAYAVLLTSQFQRFCRDLHAEAAEHLVGSAQPTAVRSVLRARLVDGRKLDQGNPNPSHLGSDFGRFGFDFWAAVRRSDPRNGKRQTSLTNLTEWRNAITHRDFVGRTLTPLPPLQLRHVQTWRSACRVLAAEFDRVVRAHVAALVGTALW